MPDLIPPHGGLSEPVNRTVPTAETADFKKQAAGLPRVPISDADLSSLYRIGDGGLSPLTGPMDRATYQKVLDDEVLIHNGKAYAWTIPISFPVTKDVAGSVKPGQTVALANSKGDDNRAADYCENQWRCDPLSRLLKEVDGLQGSADQAETDRYCNAIVGNGGQESACGWCKDKWGVSWQITPIALTKAVTDPDRAAAKRAFEAMMTMKKIDIAAIETAHRRR